MKDKNIKTIVIHDTTVIFDRDILDNNLKWLETEAKRLLEEPTVPDAIYFDFKHLKGNIDLATIKTVLEFREICDNKKISLKIVRATSEIKKLFFIVDPNCKDIFFLS